VQKGTRVVEKGGSSCAGANQGRFTEEVTFELVLQRIPQVDSMGRDSR
jgi:hypothetical protein